MQRWHTGIEARLLFLTFLHQISELDGLRDLAIQLAQVCTSYFLLLTSYFLLLTS